jgi:hypothetical protein
MHKADSIWKVSTVSTSLIPADKPTEKALVAVDSNVHHQLETHHAYVNSIGALSGVLVQYM